MIEDTSQLKQIISENKLASVSDDDLMDWYSSLYNELEPLKKRYRIFSFGVNSQYIFIFLFFTLVNGLFISFLALIGFGKVSIFYGILMILFWGVIVIIYFYISDYNSFVSSTVNKERTKMRKELIYLLNIQEELLKERNKRGLVIFQADWQKELAETHNFRVKLKKED